MKILLTGGVTGGHFYPIIAVAEALHESVREKKLVEPSLYFAAPDPYDKEMLVAQAITFVPTSAGKMRRYFSILNFFDYFKTAWGITRAIVRVFFLYPDVVFGKGGYGSFPTLLAAKLFRIPVVIHESDATPGRVNAWAGTFATKIAVSYPEAAKYFPEGKVAVTGNPVRRSLMMPVREGVHEFLGLEKDLPIIYVTGGSQGAEAVNEAVLLALPELVEKYQIVHQAGDLNIKEVEQRAKVMLANSQHANRYKPFAYLNDQALRMVAGAANLVITRAGSTIFEIALWGIPSILVPIPEPISHDQTKNAFAYARSGGAVVIEQNNLTKNLLLSEINRILDNASLSHEMAQKARAFSRADSAKLIADALLDIALSHES
ncbi:MAG TPA: UDP-N-acetylglucosamine--N-acetylmuramyl-(pentapeptide) pyrophosphoryl-undecaprenol N-acetylglucosamine transferase [Candidatus Paceibacterota bacterium]|nr:UDP-N-acetylglucosamine--N-acetylmuramyl-(pentapeptide) pyrophosphoryl-undecaprenol N-acetylglucosamine transferase [Candidatus Paceibacterota bacterium]